MNVDLFRPDHTSGHTDKQKLIVSCIVLSTRLTSDFILIRDFIKVQVGDKEMHIKIRVYA